MILTFLTHIPEPGKKPGLQIFPGEQSESTLQPKICSFGSMVKNSVHKCEHIMILVFGSNTGTTSKVLTYLLQELPL